MGRWTKPRLIAYKNQWYDDSFDYSGPVCYELGTSETSQVISAVI